MHLELKSYVFSGMSTGKTAEPRVRLCLCSKLVVLAARVKVFLPRQSANVEETVKGERILEFFTCLALVLHLLGNHVFCEARVRLNWKQSRLKSWMFQRWVSAAMATKTDPRFPDVLKSREYKSAIAWWRQGARCISLCCLLTFNLSILALRIYVDREALCKRLSWGNWT